MITVRIAGAPATAVSLRTLSVHKHWTYCYKAQTVAAQLQCTSCRDYMGLTKTSSGMRPTAAVPPISLAGLSSPPPSKDEPPTTPRSSPWRENPAFLHPGAAKPSSADPAASAQPVTHTSQPRSTASADLSERLASMSVVGSGFQRVRETSGGATDSSASGQADEGSAVGTAGVYAGANVTGRSNALGRLKDRQHQAARKTSDEDSSSKGATPAKFYLQVPSKH